LSSGDVLVGAALTAARTKEVGMTEQATIRRGSDEGRGPKYFLDIDGVEKEWDRSTITVPQLRALGGIPDGTPVIQIDEDENETTLEEGSVVILKPGHRFGKKVHWKRG
jgi:hypothetical protein